MKKTVAALVAAAALGVLGTAAAQNVAIVNGKAVPKARVDLLVKQLERSGRQVTPEMQPMLREEVIAREIFMQEAQRRGIDASEDYRQQMDLARQTIMIRALFEDFQKTNAVTEADVKAEYDKFTAANAGKEFRARHILVEKEDEAKAVIDALKKGGKFDELAKQRSKDPGSAARGGDLDWAAPGSYVKEFADALLKLKVGETTDAPVRSQFGWHIIRVDEERQAKLPAIDELRAQITQQLTQQRLQTFQEDLRKKARIE
jgi:peptidyl-prolyl cis-trans isomerase C